MVRTALVTGCAGFIGSNLTDELLSRGYKVIGIDNFTTGNLANLQGALEQDSFTLLEDDVTDPAFAESIEGAMDIVFHLAAIASVALSTREPLKVTQTNVDGTVNALECARKHGAKRFVFASSAAVYGNPDTLPVKEEYPLVPLSPYAASKIAGERYVQSYWHSFGLEYSILRFFNVYGPRQDDSEYSGVIAIFCDRAVKGEPLHIEGDGLQTRSFIHVSDVVKAVIRAGEEQKAANEIINISGPSSISVNDLARQIQALTGVETRHVSPRVGDVRDSIGDITKAQSLLGMTSLVPLEEGLVSTLEWYRSRPSSDS